MSNKGKFIDRSPNIIPAGKVSPCKDIKECFFEISELDVLDVLLRQQPRPQATDATQTPQQSQGKQYEGIYTEVRSLISPPISSPTEALIDEIKETSYASYWTSPLGQVRDPMPGLPPGLDPKNTKFGISTKASTPGGFIINPQKLPGQVNFETELGHELYVKSHNDYFTGEKVNRNYLSPPYDPDAVYGGPKRWLGKGHFVKAAMSWFNTDKVCPASQIQADLFKRRGAKLGKCLEPNEILGKLVPEDFTFGIKCDSDIHTSEELFMECRPSPEKYEIQDCVAHLNGLRLMLKQKISGFPYDEFSDAFFYKDASQKGTLPLCNVYEICDKFGVNVDKCKLEKLLKKLKILSDNECVKYEEFANLLNWKFDFPPLPKIDDIPEDHKHFETTNMVATKDWMKINNACLPTAGVRVEELRADENKFMVENLGKETEARVLINPHIYALYGVTHRDMFKPRRKTTMKEIIEHIGVKIPEELFDSLWLKSCELDNSCGASVNTFISLLHALSQIESK